MQIFVTGTDTNIGKTITTAWLCTHTDYTYFKPIQTGIEEDSDSLTIKTLSPKTEVIPEIYALPRPLSPHLSALYAGTQIDLNHITLPPRPKLFIEGAGGLMVPLNKNFLMLDLIKILEIPVILVASTRLGTINHTLLSLQALRQYNIPCLGVIMNGEPNQDNLKAIEYYGKTTVLAELPKITTLNSEQLLDVPMPKSLKQLLENNA
jgi:dethiobiotin synthetase